MDEISLPTHIFPNAKTVYGEGPVPCEYMFVGEAPGEVENEVGRPFTGPSGKLLNSALEYYTNLRRHNVYVTNIVKHRPPNNATPKVSEIKPYLPYFMEEVRKVNCRVFITLGAVALKAVDKTVKLADSHGLAKPIKFGEWEGLLVPWWHPAYALRDPQKFNDFARDAERLHDEIAKSGGPPRVTQYTLATEAEVVSALMQSWCTFGFDTETTSPKVEKVFLTDEADMVGYSVTIAPNTGWYVPTTKVGPGMAAILESPLWTKVCHNAKFEHKILRKQGVTLLGFEDTKLAGYVLGYPLTGLKTLTRQILGYDPIEYKEVTQGRDMSELDPQEIVEYAVMDSDHTLQLWTPLRQRLHDENLYDVYRTIERPIVPVLSAMEGRGVVIDEERTKDVRSRLAVEAIQAEGNFCSP